MASILNKQAALTRISICIPIYQQNVSSLVQTLLTQKSEIPHVEILLFDDGSSEEWKQQNQWLKNESEIRYEELPRNIGRAAIRNRLASAAQGELILFLDADSLIDNPRFIKNYLKHSDGKTVICGGRKYSEKCPSEEYSLHWTYGSKMESKSANLRNRKAYESFHSNNFLIPKQVWEEVPFDESLKQYGHEDTLLGFELQRQGFSILHINNEVIHGELESNSTFLHKTRLAIQNLKYLYLRGNGDFNNSVTLLRMYRLISSMKLATYVAKLYANKHEKWEQKLTTKVPSLRLFTFYKLSYLSFLMHKASKSPSI